MNRRVWCCVGLLSVLAWSDRSSIAQAPPPAVPPVPAPAPGPAGAPAVAVIPLGAQQAVDAAQYQPIIHSFVTQQFNLLATGDDHPSGAVIAPRTLSDEKQVRAKAREKLVSNCPRGVSGSYASIYCKEVNAAAESVLDKAKTMELRMNVAIVICGVANNASGIKESTGTVALEPQVRRLLDDHDAAVAYWAVKASAPLIGDMVTSPSFATNKLVPAVVACVKKHSGTDELSGDIAEDAYHALAPQEIPGATEAELGRYSPSLVGPILDLLEYRTSLFNNSLVPSPNAERTGATFLSKNYSAMTPAQQKRTVQDLVNFVTDLGQRTADYAAAQASAPKINSGMRDLMGTVRGGLKITASALVVVCNLPPINDGPVGWLARIPPGATPKEILDHSGAVFTSVQSQEPFKWVTAPAALPQLPGPAAPPAPAPAAAVPAPKA